MFISDYLRPETGKRGPGPWLFVEWHKVLSLWGDRDVAPTVSAAPARTRRGTPCRAPAMANGRCRMHGGKLRGGPPGNRHAWKHGRYSREAIERRREVAELVRSMRALARRLAV